MSMAMVLMRYLSFGLVESLMVMLSKIVYGDLSKYGIKRPQEGPFTTKIKYGRYPIIDLGTCQKIKTGQIQVNLFFQKYNYSDNNNNKRTLCFLFLFFSFFSPGRE